MRVNVQDGHLPIPKRIQKKHGDEYELIVRDDRLVLVPVDDPLATLREEFAGTDLSPSNVDEVVVKQMCDDLEESVTDGPG